MFGFVFAINNWNWPRTHRYRRSVDVRDGITYLNAAVTLNGIWLKPNKGMWFIDRVHFNFEWHSQSYWTCNWKYTRVAAFGCFTGAMFRTTNVIFPFLSSMRSMPMPTPACSGMLTHRNMEDSRTDKRGEKAEVMDKSERQGSNNAPAESRVRTDIKTRGNVGESG